MNVRRLVAVLLLLAVAGCAVAATDARGRVVSRDAGLRAVATVNAAQVQPVVPTTRAGALGPNVFDGCTDAALTPIRRLPAMSGGPADRSGFGTTVVQVLTLPSQVVPTPWSRAGILLRQLPTFGLAVTAISVCRT